MRRPTRQRFTVPPHPNTPRTWTRVALGRSFRAGCLLLAALSLGACTSTSRARAEAQPTALTELDRDHAFALVAAWEDQRSDGAGGLAALAGHPDAAVRARAVAALGRLPRGPYGKPVTDALCAALVDNERPVRRSAAFALGVRADPACAAALLAALGDPDDRTRAALIEAASKVATPRLREEVLIALADPSDLVRMEAAVGPHRWPASSAQPEPDPSAAGTATPEAVDAALLRVAAGPLQVDPGANEAAQADPEVVWRALFSLQRRASAAGRQVFLDQSRAAQHVLVRLFAVKGLAQLEPDDALRAALEHALLDEDWRVVVEALTGVAKGANPRSVDALERSLAHPSAHVRAAAFEALGHQAASDRITGLLERARVDRSPSVRATALEAEARVRGASMAPDLELKMSSRDPLMRTACARAARHLPAELAVPYLEELSEDRSLRVATTAIEVLGAFPTPAARQVLSKLLQGRDNGRRLAAVVALRTRPNPEDVAALRRAFERSRGDIATEVQFNCVLWAGEIGGDEALAFVTDALRHEHPYVRQVAYEVLERAGRAPEQWPSLTWPERDLPRIGRELPLRNPTVEVSTNRGLMTFELFADEAPVHVYNFLELARADHYDGLNFHRVVSDFVVQGGCYRGDGNGARPWAGDALRHEISPRKYVRGSLGMPRNEDIESGGSQFFVTHRPTPHLDGRYTIFGELRSGALVLDAIEAGDVILDVRVVEE